MATNGISRTKSNQNTKRQRGSAESPILLQTTMSSNPKLGQAPPGWMYGNTKKDGTKSTQIKDDTTSNATSDFLRQLFQPSANNATTIPGLRPVSILSKDNRPNENAAATTPSDVVEELPLKVTQIGKHQHSDRPGNFGWLPHW